MVVRHELEKLGLHPLTLELGEVEIQESNIDHVIEDFRMNLQSLGFSIIDDKKSKTIDKIKNLIIDLVQNKNNEINTNLSVYLTEHLTQDYGSLSKLFSEVEGTTIEKYFIYLKIEKVKELLMYDELTLNEIAILLNYSSVAHLSNQFKKVTGFSASYFKQLKEKKRKQIDDL